MSAVNVTNARKNLYKILEDLQSSHEPVTITGKSGSAVLISEEDWKSIEETLFLLSIPGMRDSLVKGMKEPLTACLERPDW